MNSKSSLYPILVLALSLLLCSCEKEIKFSGKLTEPRPVVFVSASDGMPVQVDLSMSVFILDRDGYNDKFYSGLTNRSKNVYVSFNDEDTYTELKCIHDPSVNPSENQYFYGDFCYKYATERLAKAGDTVHVRVDIEGRESVYAQATIPQQPEFEMVDFELTNVSKYEYEGWGTEVYGKGIFTLRLKDNGSERNYYQLSLEGSDHIEEYVNNCPYQSNDIIFTQELNIVDEIEMEEENYYDYYFTDDVISGKDHTFKISTRVACMLTEEDSVFTYRVSMKSLTADTYKYYSSMDAESGAILDIFAEKASIYSNIDGAIGCCLSTSEKSFSVNVTLAAE